MYPFNIFCAILCLVYVFQSRGYSLPIFHFWWYFLIICFDVMLGFVLDLALLKAMYYYYHILEQHYSDHIKRYSLIHRYKSLVLTGSVKSYLNILEFLKHSVFFNEHMVVCFRYNKCFLANSNQLVFDHSFFIFCSILYFYNNCTKNWSQTQTGHIRISRTARLNYGNQHSEVGCN